MLGIALPQQPVLIRRQKQSYAKISWIPEILGGRTAKYRA